nr:MAG TPA: PROTEIN/RNA Complex, archaeal, ribosomal, 50S, protein.0A [Bacteriophage sp.]
MTENEAIKICNTIGFAASLSNPQEIPLNTTKEELIEAMKMGIQALETIKKLSDRDMTTEVLENYMQFEDECVKKGFTLKSVIEAREKQIAMKPDFTGHKAFALCPCCGEGLIDKQKYCDNCGQKIDLN